MGAERQDEGQESTGFTVKDKRRFNPDGSPRPEGEVEATDREEPSSPASPPSPDAKPTAGAEAEATARAGEAAARAASSQALYDMPPADADAPADFTGLILSLAQTAMIDLGAAPHPDSGEVQPDLRLARQSIDMVAMLKEKTTGNLTDEESRLLDGILYQLRLAFLEARRRAERSHDR